MELSRNKKCWIDNEKKIISFHPISGLSKKEFRTHQDLLEYAIIIMNKGYKAI